MTGAAEVARRSRGTPRIANRLLRRVRDYAEVKHQGQINADIADAALKMLDIDQSGLDVMDCKYLEAILFKFSGGPVGLDNIAAAIGESTDTIEDVTVFDSTGFFTAYSTWQNGYRIELSTFRHRYAAGIII